MQKFKSIEKDKIVYARLKAANDWQKENSNNQLKDLKCFAYCAGFW